MPKKTKIILSESSVGRRMRKFQTKEVAESDDDEVFDKCLFRRRFPANREDYLRDNWIFIKNHLAKHDLQVKVKFKKRMIAMNVVPKTKNVMLILKGRYLLKLMTFNIPYQYCYRILRSDMHVAFIKAGSMFKNQDIYYKRRHRLLEPDIRTLTYTELFTNCNVLLDQKMIILLGTEKGVKRASSIVWDTMGGNYHPISRLKELMVQYVQREIRPKINPEDWNDFISKFPPSLLVNENTINDSSFKDFPYGSQIFHNSH